MYAKGSNFIPADALQPRVTTEYLDSILSSAVASHQNMVRVWGGGTYQVSSKITAVGCSLDESVGCLVILRDWEAKRLVFPPCFYHPSSIDLLNRSLTTPFYLLKTDDFYDMADEKGLLVWQEMMFACALYPRDAPFLALVADEVEAQVLRLQAHASVAIWGGNNENEGALEWYPQSSSYEPGGNPKLYAADYVALYGACMNSLVWISRIAVFRCISTVYSMRSYLCSLRYSSRPFIHQWTRCAWRWRRRILPWRWTAAKGAHSSTRHPPTASSAVATNCT